MVESALGWWENPTLSATILREKRQITLPAEVVRAAGLKVSDHIDWRFEGGEIHGRKLVHERQPRRIVGRLVKHKDGFILQAPGITVDPQEIGRAVREERDSR